jgi:hypothetical protein
VLQRLAGSQFAVIPAKAGIQLFFNLPKGWIPAFAGMTSKNASSSDFPARH